MITNKGDLISHYEMLAMLEDEANGPGPRLIKPPRRADDGFEMAYFELAFPYRFRERRREPDEVRSALERGRASLQKGLRMCESPIEQRILHWLVFANWTQIGDGLETPEVVAKGESVPDRCGLAIVPQFESGPYRIDFAVFSTAPWGRVSIAVECDGAGYHDADKDAKRDAYFLGHGVKTVRATGAEIFRHPDAVFERINRALLFAAFVPRGGLLDGGQS